MTGRSLPLSEAPPPSFSDKLRRATWGLVQATLFRWSPVPFHAWRRALLRLYGASIGPGAHPYPDAAVWAPWNLEMGEGSCLGPRTNCYSVARIRLGNRALVSQGAVLCAASHDYNRPDFPLLVGEIDIGDGAWVASEAFVGPGVRIGERAVAFARAVVVKDVAADELVGGNPARVVGSRRGA